MKFSIITPTKNRPEWLHRAGMSVVHQTHPDWEWIVLDNSDEPGHVGGDPRIKYFYEPDVNGVADAYNRALAKASGDVVHPLSDDDRLASRALEIVAREMGDRDWLYGRTAFNNRDGVPQVILGAPWNLERLRSFYYLGGAVYWRKHLTDQLGGFKTDYESAADYDLYLRFGEHSEPKYITDILYCYTDWEGTDSRVNAAQQADATERIAA